MGGFHFVPWTSSGRPPPPFAMMDPLPEATAALQTQNVTKSGTQVSQSPPPHLHPPTNPRCPPPPFPRFPLGFPGFSPSLLTKVALVLATTDPCQRLTEALRTENALSAALQHASYSSGSRSSGKGVAASTPPPPPPHPHFMASSLWCALCTAAQAPWRWRSFHHSAADRGLEGVDGRHSALGPADHP